MNKPTLPLRAGAGGVMLLGMLVAAAPARADVSLPSVIASHMVLQRDASCPIWGWASPGEAVTVEFARQKRSTKADADGAWSVRLKPMKANKSPQTLTVRGSNTLALDDVLVGEVWLCSGQSNMEFTVSAVDNARTEIAGSANPLIRHIKIPHRPSDKPEKNVSSDGWKVSAPDTVGSFTAVGYFFGRELAKTLDVPVGLIGSNWGGTRIEPWIPPVGFRHVEALSDIASKLDTFPLKVTQPDRNDPAKKVTTINFQTPLALYNGMIAPLVPFAIRGAIWYQGESNNGEGSLYLDKMRALIDGWRTLWHSPDMPFYFVQLAPYRYGGDPTNLAGIWDAQRRALEIPHTGMAVITDIGNITDIHPRNKQEVGRRLALWALAKTYHKPIAVYSGPLYRSMKVEGGRVRVRFDQTGGGLQSRDGKPLTHFEVAGPDGKFVPARAEIVDNAVIVSSPEVSDPTAVRFGWNQEAEPNLINKEGLPASPFKAGP